MLVSIVDKTIVLRTNRTGSASLSYVCRLEALWKMRKGTRLGVLQTGGLSVLF